ncbi:MAG: hypothetical protein WDO19_15215 [Bacteroidota bacterium]
MAELITYKKRFSRIIQTPELKISLQELPVASYNPGDLFIHPFHFTR